jgi:hypothetical protein
MGDFMSDGPGRSRSRRCSVLFFRCIAIFVLIAAGAETYGQSASTAHLPSVGPLSTTTVAELLTEEARLHDVSPSAKALAETAVEVATQAATRRLTTHPRDLESVLSVLHAINSALAGQNFLQPPREDLWVHTLGEAMTPHAVDDPDVQEGLQYAENAARLPFIDRSKPMRWVDCDMGSLFFIAVGQRLGWDIRLAALPHHNYVRWHVSPSLIVNWDWSASASLPDADYREQVPLGDHGWLRFLGQIS